LEGPETPERGLPQPWVGAHNGFHRGGAGAPESTIPTHRRTVAVNGKRAFSLSLSSIGSSMAAILTLRATLLLAGTILAYGFGQAAQAAEAGGIKFADTVKVSGQTLQLNGLGVRNRQLEKFYAAGLYLQDKAGSAEEVLGADGPRRVELVMMRDVSSQDFGEAFITGLNNNMDKPERQKIVAQIIRFGEMFSEVPGLKKGDRIDVDWLPGTGTQCYVNGKKVGQVSPDLVFYNAILKIWLGDKPTDAALKPRLLSTVAQR
jgi:hypothetical protein